MQFDDAIDSQVKDIVDAWRLEREKAIRTGASIEEVTKPKSVDFEGHGVLIVAKETANSSMPLCLGLGNSGNEVILRPCFHDWVPGTLGEQWETGGVIIEETLLHNRWVVGPCTSDGTVERQ
jgi:hypothetical protein